MKAALLLLPGLLCAAAPSGDAELRASVLGRPTVLRTTARTAGAIDSFRWGGEEFIDTHDHGRQLQSAVNADFEGRFFVETYNPTEAGSVADALGPRSSSVLEGIQIKDGVLSTRTRMAYWLPPGGSSHGRPAFNREVVSGHVLRKNVKFGCEGVENALDYAVAFSVPPDREHRYLQFEVLTGYMPSRFSVPLSFDAAKGDFIPRDPSNQGELSAPVALSTPDGKAAMGVLLLSIPSSAYAKPGYGSFFFARDDVAKWNVVVRLRSERLIPPSDHPFRCAVVFGSREDCRAAFRVLSAVRPVR
ncbi:MAG: hypothetical protein ACKOQ9_07470 [Verrucomicrobiota bacterium]